MKGQIIAIGDELISGRIVNTTSSFAASRLFAAGHVIKKITVVGDDPDDIKEALLAGLEESQFLIVSGGLGPTTDDITNESVSRALGLPLERNTQVESQIREMEEELGEHAPEQFKQKLVMLPKGAKVLKPDGHMAGYELKYRDVYMFFLPGVPEQFRLLMVEKVLPRLNELDTTRPYVAQRVFKLFGLQEIEINLRIEALAISGKGVKIGYYPVFPEVHITVTVIGESEPEVLRHLESAAKAIKDEFEEFIVAESDEGSLAATLGGLLETNGLMLAAAESCTGGLLGATLTSVPGSSGWFDRSMVTYSNRAKMELLGVSEATLREFGAVSKQTALEMVKGARERSGCECALAITGIAGPDGGTPDKPVGTVFIALSVNDTELVHRFLFQGDRWQIRRLTVETSLDWLRRFLKYDSVLPGYKPVE
ncbi:MAG: CinA family nicotinamide mononucleotide deamidase-related protein [Thermodesulfobacteria bacterium]|nr:CinA family nicotinamide mononucleotide deamidase-related protein [Thermodesulfobacteriota bacterium]